NDVKERLSVLGKEKHVQISIEQQGFPTTVTGVHRILDEMIFNLCENAVKYNKENGSVIIRITGTHQGSEEKCVKLCVIDTGIGIPKEDLDRVFERFYRVDKSRSRDTGGTGLGLSIVKHGALLHHAKIELSSIPGTGTTVCLSFPTT
ncbi:MAG: two-component sensor histidine kinase, partial [Flexilinea flocculi]|nr:two-component sensor histidine kinase [Flexilinea flocculi]